MCETDGHPSSDPLNHCHSCLGHPDGGLSRSAVGVIYVTREEVVREAQDDSEVEWFDYAVARTGPIPRGAWEHSRWVHRQTLDLPSDERRQFVAIEIARRTAESN